jgi:cell division protein FtsB
MTDTLERAEHEQPRQQRRKRSRWKSVLFLALVVSLGLVASGVLPLQQYLEREIQVTGAQERLASIEGQNDTIASDVVALRTDQEIERVAREQYGFVRPGEVGYVVIVPESSVTETEVPPPVSLEASNPGFFERVWSYLTGDDIAADG